MTIQTNRIRNVHFFNVVLSTIKLGFQSNNDNNCYTIKQSNHCYSTLWKEMLLRLLFNLFIFIQPPEFFWGLFFWLKASFKKQNFERYVNKEDGKTKRILFDMQSTLSYQPLKCAKRSYLKWDKWYNYLSDVFLKRLYDWLSKDL